MPKYSLATVEQTKKDLLVKTLRHTKWNLRQTAILLDVTRETVYAWIKRFKMQSEFQKQRKRLNGERE